MKTHLLLVLSILLTINIFSQDEAHLRLPETPCNIRSYHAPTWFEGYIVLDGGDTIRGKMIPPSTSYDRLNADDYYLPFVSEKTCEMNFRPDGLRCFNFLPAAYANLVVDSNEVKSLKLWTHIYKYPYNDHAPFDYFISTNNDIDAKRRGGKIFVQELRVGSRCTVYGFEQQTQQADGSPQSTSGFKTKCFLQKADGARVIVDWANFKYDMKRFFKDCPALVQKIEANQYTYKNWPEMVEFYNHSPDACTAISGH